MTARGQGQPRHSSGHHENRWSEVHPEAKLRDHYRSTTALCQKSVGRVTLLGDACHAMLPFMARAADAAPSLWVKTGNAGRAFDAREEML